MVTEEAKRIAEISKLSAKGAYSGNVKTEDSETPVVEETPVNIDVGSSTDVTFEVDSNDTTRDESVELTSTVEDEGQNQETPEADQDSNGEEEPNPDN